MTESSSRIRTEIRTESRTKARARRALAAALAGTAALGLSAVSRAQSPTQARPPANPPAALSDGLVRIGILNDQSGTYAEFGGRSSVEAARMAVEDFGGTMDGARIEIVTADHQNKPDIASGIARQWYDRDGVDAIMELTTSSVALAVQNLSREKKRITITTGAATSDLTGKQCSPYGYHWAYDTHALAVGTGGALVQQGGDTWFFITADYAFGHTLEAETGRYVVSKGGKVVGSVRHPLSAQDYSSFLLQAQGSGAKVIGMANAGLDTSNTIKQAAEYGINEGGQHLAALLFTLAEVHGLGLKVAQGLTLTEGWYWDLNDETRAFAKRFMARTGKMPNMVHTGTYSAVLQYLKAVKAAGTDETEAVNAQLRAMPVDDVFAHGGTVLPNGRMVHDMYLFEVKKPADSKGEWDLYRLLSTIPGADAYAKAEESGCPTTTAAK